MFRALFSKEWRQLRALRWGALAVTAILPVAFVVGAAAAERGWALARLRGYSAATMWGEALPAALVIVVWPLFAALFAAHAWCAERQDGTEAFRLVRPVPPGTAWAAKAAAAAASIAVIVSAGAALDGLLASATAPGGGVVALTRVEPTKLAPFAVALMLAVFAASAAAGAFVRSFFLAGVAGLVAVVAVVALAGRLLVMLPFAFVEVGGWPVHATWGLVLLVPGFLTASWWGFARGEPAGRRRPIRVSAALAVVAVMVAATLGLTAWGMARWNAAQHGSTGWPTTPSVGYGLWVDSLSGASHLVDIRTAAVVRSFPPPVLDVAWNAHGTRAAVATLAGPLGSVRNEARLTIVDTAGHVERGPLELPSPEGWSMDLQWAGDRVVALVPSRPRYDAAELPWSVVTVDPASAAVHRIDLDGAARFAWLERPVQSDDLFVHLVALTGAWRVHRIDAVAGTETPEDAVSGRWAAPGVWSSPLSPTGRYIVVPSGKDKDSPRAVYLRAGGAAIGAPIHGPADWLRNDRLVWLDGDEGTSRLWCASPGAQPRLLATWDARDLRLHASPDRRRLLVTGEIQAVWDAETERWIELARAPGDVRVQSVMWAGAATVAWRGPDYLVLADLDAPDSRRVVFGTDPFTR